MVKLALIFMWAMFAFVAVVGFLIFILAPIFIRPKKPIIKKTPFFSMSKIEQMIQDPSTSPKDLQTLIKSFSTYHKIPEKENGISPKSSKTVLDLIFTLGGHSNMSPDLRQVMFNKFIAANPQYAQELRRGQ
ncbi:MAG: hypothetical protein CSA19_00665 [Deltaproteobacteria bacterium]|nr:MAG: hypothetical protein CSA19_00665 [Deltaproteobacteria bacterium]